MSQTEDTELRDLVVDTLEKNGSLAKLRARLRSDIYAALENEHNATVRSNPELDRTLSTPDGVLSLLLVQEFLEYNNLQVTTFLYKAETGQGKSYVYDGRSHVADQFKNGRVNKLSQCSILTQLLMCVRESDFRFDCNAVMSNGQSTSETNCSKKDDVLNATCIVHDNSHNSSQSHCDANERNGVPFNLSLSNSSEISISDNGLVNSNDENRSGEFRNENDSIASMSASSISDEVEVPSNASSTSIKSNEVDIPNLATASTSDNYQEDVNSDSITEENVSSRSPLCSREDEENISAKSNIEELKNIDARSNTSNALSVPEEIPDTPHSREVLFKIADSGGLQPNTVECRIAKSPRSESIHYSTNSFITSLIDSSYSKILKDNHTSRPLGTSPSPSKRNGKNAENVNGVTGENKTPHKNITIRGKDSDSGGRSDSFEFSDFLLDTTNSLSRSKSHDKSSPDIHKIINSNKVTLRKIDSNDNCDRSDSFEYNPDLMEEWQDD